VSIEMMLSIASLVLGTGAFGLLLRLTVQWSELRDRSDILWYHYCRDHATPFRATGRGFDERSHTGERE
jgi:hypothetical protein